MPMPKGPKGRKRTADVIGNAVKAMRIATREEEADFPADDKQPMRDLWCADATCSRHKLSDNGVYRSCGTGMQ
jgi:hypothetical protein